jgi:hypothetical protein
MRLTITVEGKELASVPLDAEKAGRSDYLQAKRRLLQAAHHNVLRKSQEPPVYCIQVSSKTNKKVEPCVVD